MKAPASRADRVFVPRSTPLFPPFTRGDEKGVPLRNIEDRCSRFVPGPTGSLPERVAAGRTRRRITGLAVSLVLNLSWVAHAQRATATPRDWPMFRGDCELTGVVRASLPDDLRVLWKFEVPEPITSTAAIVDGVVFVGADDGVLYALDLEAGTLRWKYETGDSIRSSPTVFHKTVFVGDSTGVMHAVDAATGRMKWRFATDGEIISSANVHDDRIVFGSYDGSVYCLAAAGGKLLWKFETQGRVHGTPGIADTNVLVAGCDEHLHVLGLADGISAGKVALGSVSGASATIMGSRVFVGTYGSRVLCIDWSRRSIVWSFADPDREFPYMSSAAVTADAVFVGGRDKRLRALDPRNGKLIWTFVTRGRIDSSPVVVENRVFVGSSDGNLYAVSRETGREFWRFESGAPISASPAVVDGRLVIGNEDGVLYCFGLTARQPVQRTQE